MSVLVVEDGDAASLARELADRRGTSVREAVVASLRASLDRIPPSSVPPQPQPVPSLDEFTPEQRADYEALRSLVEEARAHIVPGATSDHSDMYDEYGLPI